MYESAPCQAMIRFCFSGFLGDLAQENPVRTVEAVGAPRMFFFSCVFVLAFVFACSPCQVVPAVQWARCSRLRRGAIYSPWIPA